MRRGTTPTHIFKTKVDLRSVDAIFMTYKQEGRVIVEKTIDDITIEEEQLSLTLTQADTLGFSTIGDVEIQCRAKFPDGAAVASQVIKVPVGKILKEGII